MTRRLYSLCGADRAVFFSPHCWKAAMALAHKGLEFEEVAASFKDVGDLSSVVNKTPATVPILDDHGTIVSDSFAIAGYLDETYPAAPSLFAGQGGHSLSRMIESWSQTQLHPAIARIALRDIHDLLDDENKRYFRQSREAIFGKALEAVVADRQNEEAGFPAKLQPLRHMLRSQPFIGGDGPLFADYIVFGALQWLRMASGLHMLAQDDPVLDWFERCLDLHGGHARKAKLP